MNDQDRSEPIPTRLARKIAGRYGKTIVCIASVDAEGRHAVTRYGPGVEDAREMPTPIREIVRLEDEVERLKAENAAGLERILDVQDDYLKYHAMYTMARAELTMLRKRLRRTAL